MQKTYRKIFKQKIIQISMTKTIARGLYLIDKLACAFVAGTLLYGSVCLYSKDVKNAILPFIAAGTVAISHMAKKGELEDRIDFWKRQELSSH